MSRPDVALAQVFKQDDAFTQWIAYLDRTGPPADGVVLPQGANLVRTLRYLEIPEEDIPDIAQTVPSPDASPAMWWVLERAVNSLVLHMGKEEGPPRFGQLQDEDDPQHRYFYVHVFVATLPYTKAYFRERQIPMDVQQASLADLGRNVRVHRKRNGVGGLGVMWWMMLHFRGMIYDLGRLQFERKQLDANSAAIMSEQGVRAGEGDHVLSIHIPDFSGPMTVEACDESIERAQAFFAEHFPDEPVLAGICYSWLLDPQLRDYLRPESNIIRFQDRFTLGPAGDSNGDESVLRFVFGPLHDDLDSYPQRSSLERGVIANIRAGKHWQFRFGWFRW